MKELMQSVTKTMKALPVSLERAQMPPERVAEQNRATLLAVAAWAIGAGILHFFPALPQYFGMGIIVYGLLAFDPRLFGDFFKYLTQFIAVIRGGNSSGGTP